MPEKRKSQKQIKEAQLAQQKKAYLDALEKSLGVVTTACKNTGIPRRTFYNWLSNDEEFAKEVNDMKEIALDYAESKLHARITEGSDTAIIFFLKTQGKSRGYIERSEIANVTEPAFIVKPEQKGVLKVLKTIDERNKKAGA
jgi:hypothetical protein